MICTKLTSGFITFVSALNRPKRIPSFGKYRPGDAHIVLRRDSVHCEDEARSIIESAQWKIQKLHIARVTDEVHLSSMPPEAQATLPQSDQYFEVAAYETGGGPEASENPFG
jgi:hypothetical protein